MDFRSLSEERDGLEQELVTLKGDPRVQVPSVLKLVELEITRLNEILQSMGPDDMHDVDEDGEMMIDRVANEFELTDATSVLVFITMVIHELRSINQTFHPLLVRIAISTLTVVKRLEKELIIEFTDMISNVGSRASTSQEPEPEPEPKPAPVDDSQSQVGVSSGLLPDDPCRNLEWCISSAIETITRFNPQDLCADIVTKLVQKIVTGINVDEENVRRLIFQKCEEAIESHKKKSAQGDEGESSSKQD